MTYKLCKRVIENKSYDNKESMMDKLDVFLLNNRITDSQYNELVAMIEKTK